MSTYIYKLSSKETNKVCIVACQRDFEMSLDDNLKDDLKTGMKKCRKYLNNKKIYNTSFELLKYDDCKITILEDNINLVVGEDYYKIREKLLEYAKKYDCVNIPLCECGDYYFLKEKSKHMTSHFHKIQCKIIEVNNNILEIKKEINTLTSKLKLKCFT